MVDVIRLILAPYACCGIMPDYLFSVRMLKTSIPQLELVFWLCVAFFYFILLFMLLLLFMLIRRVMAFSHVRICIF